MEDWVERLFKHKNFLDVYEASCRTFPASSFNQYVIASVLLVDVGILFLSAFTMESAANVSNRIYVSIGSIVEISTSFSVGMLGFLIAGFGAFIAFSRPKTLALYAKMPYMGPKKPESYNADDLSILQYLLYSFVNTFFFFLLLLGLSVAVDVFFMPEGIVAAALPDYRVPVLLSYSVNWVVLIAFTLLLSECILQLKSFIWSIYQTFLSNIAQEGLDASDGS